MFQNKADTIQFSAMDSDITYKSSFGLELIEFMFLK